MARLDCKRFLIPTALSIDLRAFSEGDRGEALRHGDAAVPGGAAGFDDGVGAGESPVGEGVPAEVLPEVLDRVEFGAVCWRRHQGDVVRDVRLVGPGTGCRQGSKGTSAGLGRESEPVRGPAATRPPGSARSGASRADLEGPYPHNRRHGRPRPRRVAPSSGTAWPPPPARSGFAPIAIQEPMHIGRNCVAYSAMPHPLAPQPAPDIAAPVSIIALAHSCRGGTLARSRRVRYCDRSVEDRPARPRPSR